MVFYPFEVTVPHIIYACLGGFIVLFGMFSLFLRERLYISEACWAFLFGVIIGPYCGDIFNPRSWAHDEETVNVITLELTRVILAVGVFAIGVELPKAYMKRHWKSLFFLLVPVMTWGWLVCGAFIYALIPGLNFLTSLAVAACLTPTDPILAAAVIGGKWADKHVPAHIRHLLAAESGCNDGAAFPFLFLSLYLLLDYPDTGAAIRDWFLLLWLYQVLLGAVLGAAIGIAFRYIMKFCERMDLIDRHSYVAQYLSLAMFTIGVCTLLGSDDLLAAFACGTAFAWDGFFNRQTEESVFSSVIDLLFNIAAFVYLGAWMPFNKFEDAALTLSVWRLIVIAILVLMFRRLPIMIAVYKWIPDVKNFREAVFCGHFGPVGVGAVFISTLALEIIHRAHKTEENSANYHQIHMLEETIHPIVGFMVLCSITVHGLSIPSFSLGRRVHSVGRTWSRHATGTSIGGQPEWALNTTLVTRGDEKIVINRDHNQRALEVDVERGSDSEKTRDGSGGSVEEKQVDEPESSTTPPDRLDIRIDSNETMSPRDVHFLDSQSRRHSVNRDATVFGHTVDVTPPPKAHTANKRPSIPMNEVTEQEGERMTGRGGDPEVNVNEILSEWQEGHDLVIERKAGPGADPEVTVIKRPKDPNSPGFREHLESKVSHELHAIAGGLHRPHSKLGGEVSLKVRRRHSQRSGTSPSGSNHKGKQRARASPLPSSSSPHIVITGDSSGDDGEDGWASEDDEGAGSKSETPRSRKGKLAHFMVKRRRGSFRGGKESSHKDVDAAEEKAEEQPRRGRDATPAQQAPGHRRTGSDFARGLMAESPKNHGSRIQTRESSPARSVRFQDGNRPSVMRHEQKESQRSV